MTHQHSSEAQRFAVDLFRIVVTATLAHRGDEPAMNAAATMAREQLVDRLIELHGRDRAQAIIDDAVDLSAQLIDIAAKYWGVPNPSMAAGTTGATGSPGTL